MNTTLQLQRDRDIARASRELKDAAATVEKMMNSRYGKLHLDEAFDAVQRALDECRNLREESNAY